MPRSRRDRYLVDTSTLSRYISSESMQDQVDALDAVLCLSVAQCNELRYTARNTADMQSMQSFIDGFVQLEPKSGISDLCALIQHAMAQHGVHRSAGALDVLTCGIAVQHNVPVLNTDHDFGAVAKAYPELQQVYVSG